jgi:hypothetical protein
VDPATRVCPFCGDQPGAGVFCAACGHNLAAVQRLPTWAEWEEQRLARGSADEPSDALAARCAEATAAFLAAMRAAGNAGATDTPMPNRSAFRKARHAHGWVLRPVVREDFEKPRRYEAGLVLTTEGRFHRLDSELRGWGQRNFPQYHHTASSDPIEMPVDERLVADLMRVLNAHGIA